MNRTGKVGGVHRKLKVRVQAAEIEAEPEPLPEGPFRTIVVDPPWHYDKRAADPSLRLLPYPTMSVEEIVRFRPGGSGAKSIPEIGHPDCVLWLWATNAHLPDAFQIAAEWGFTYKTLVTWDKIHFGTGEWLRGQTEHCLFCVRGRPVVRLSSQTTLIREKRTGTHSQKPEAFYELVESLCPGSKVEVFSRTERSGWMTYGDECGTPSRQDKLNELIAICNAAEPGHRSEPDFALCCYAIRDGVDRDKLWPMVQDIGKFGERGEEYINLTWDKAASCVREESFEKAKRKANSSRHGAAGRRSGPSSTNASGKIGASQIRGRRIRYTEQDLLQYLAGRRYEPE